VFDLTTPALEIVFRTAVVYLTVLILLRVAGKRELGQLTSFDLVVILVIANSVQNAMNGGDNSLLGGIIAATTLTGANVVVARYGEYIPFLRKVLAGEPTLLLQDGKPIEEHLKRESVTVEEIETAARQHGIPDLDGVSAAILEPDGSISIISKEGQRVHRTPRRFRQFRHR